MNLPESNEWTPLAFGSTSLVYVNSDKTLVKKKYKKNIDQTFGTNSDFYKREKFVLIILSGLSHFPEIKSCDDKELSIVMNYCGVPLSEENSPENLDIQLKEAIETLNNKEILVADLGQKNTLVLNGTIYLIDFGLSIIKDHCSPEFNSNLKSKLSSEVNSWTWNNDSGDFTIPSYGYRLKDDVKRWQYILPELPDKDENYTFLDTGSNFGFFSLNLAYKYRQSTVFSVEGSYGTGNKTEETLNIISSPGIISHIDHKFILELDNNKIIPNIFDSRHVELLLSQSVCFDFQIGFSVLHWITDISIKKGYIKFIREDILQFFVNYPSVANTSFIELPDLNQKSTLGLIFSDFTNIQSAISDLCSEKGLKVNVKKLGTCNWWGVRETLRVDLHERRDTSASSSQIIKILES
jgi:hypothetical protein